MLFTSDSAKQFLLSKIADQAAHDGVTLDDIERRVFLFSESGGNPDIEANDVFEKNYDAQSYESKVTKLLRKSYSRDKRNSDRLEEWKAVLKALSKEDFYGLVMVDQAGIRRPQQGLWEFELSVLPSELVELGIVLLGFVVVFRPEALHVHLPDWVRWLAYPLFVWLFWYAGRVLSRMQLEKSLKKAKSQNP
jgi:hypothetical protein